MVTVSTTLDWRSVDVTLLWLSPKNVKKPQDIYVKLWGLIQTVNTTTHELEQALKQCDDPRKRPVLEKTLADKRRLYPHDEFPLIAFHPTTHSYQKSQLMTNTPFALTLAFGGEQAHLAQAWFAWFTHRLSLENTGFEVLLHSWQQHQVTLPAIKTLTDNEQTEQTDKDLSELSLFIDMPALLHAKIPQTLEKQWQTHLTNISPAPPHDTPDPAMRLDDNHQFVMGLLASFYKRLCQWFPSQQAMIGRWLMQAMPHLLSAPVCTYQLYERHDIVTNSKTSARQSKQQKQRHHGQVGWLTFKGLWAQLDALWQVFFSIHLLGQRSGINGLGYLLPAKEAPSDPPTLMQSYFCQIRHVRQAVQEVLTQHDLEPTFDESGSIMQAQAISDKLLAMLSSQNYEPKPTTAFLLDKPHGGTRRIEQLDQLDMMIHKLLFIRFAPIVDAYQSPMSLGYRKGYSRERIRERVQSLLDCGFGWVIELDIEDFFNSIPLDRLWQRLAYLLPQREADSLALLQRLMQVGYYQNGKLSGVTRDHGLMQGSPLSPLLANLYLAQLDAYIAQQKDIAFVRYADDVLVFCRSTQDATATLIQIEQYLHEIGLQLSLAKTNIHHVAQGFEFLGYRFDREGAEDTSIVPILKQRKPLLLTGDAKFVGVNGAAVEIRQYVGHAHQNKHTPNKNQTPHKQLLQVVPFRRISQLIILGSHNLSSLLLTACAKAQVSVHFVNQSGFQVGTMGPINAQYFAVSAKQYQRHTQLKDSERLAIACDIVCAKINNYQTWIKNSYHKGDNDILSQLETLKQNASSSTDTAKLMGYEGQAAKLCFARLQQCFIPEQASTFSSHRRSRGGKDRLNSLLNFGYYWLFTRISSLLRSHGLNPYLSFLHDSEQDYETLVYDLMEMFRVQVDKTVLRVINRKQIQAKDFYLHESKGWHLTNAAVHLYSNELQTTLSAPLNGTVLEDILLIQIRALQNWAQSGASLVWFYWLVDKENPRFSAPDAHRENMTID